VFSDAREWRYIIESIAALIEEATFVVTPEGVKLRALDPSRVAMVDLELPSTAFEEYSCEAETRVGVNFDDMKKILKRCKKDDKVEYEVAGGKLKIKIIGKATRSFVLPLIDIGAETLPTPRVAFTARVKLLSDAVEEAIRDAEVIADTVKLEASEEMFAIKAMSDKGDLEVQFGRESGSLIEYEVTEPAVASYSLEYMGDIVKKSAKIADLVTIEFATNKPVALTFEIPLGGRLVYYLAPRME